MGGNGFGVTRDSDWRSRALCLGTGPGLFYLDRGGAATDAKAICAGCEVREACLAEALTLGETTFGIWGGLEPRARRAIKMAARHEVRPQVADLLG